MAGGGTLVLLIDEIATMVKVTAEKTAKVKKPVAYAVEETGAGNLYFKHDIRFIFDIAKGSLRNKTMLVPVALGLNTLLPWAVLPLIAAGGAYFSHEGLKKLRKSLKGEGEAHLCRESDAPPTAVERAAKIKEALRTDMVLSAEIIAITMALVTAMPVLAQAAVLSGVALGATVAAYTTIAGIIKMEDFGGWLANRPSESKAGAALRALGRGILHAKPHIMNGISTAGTVSVFMVGGGLIFHGIPWLGHGVSHALASVIASPYLQSVAKLGAGFVAGLATGLSITAAEDGARALARGVARGATRLRQMMTPRAKAADAPAPAPQVLPDHAVEAQTAPAADFSLNLSPAFEAAAAQDAVSPADSPLQPASPATSEPAKPVAKPPAPPA